MSSNPRALPIGPDPRAALPALRAMLDGAGPLLLPHAPGAVPRLGDGGREAPPAGVAVATSGSTGAPKRAVLPTAQLRASAQATADVIGAGRWLLTLPPHHIAGLQVVLRSLLAGHEPAPGPVGAFTPGAFVAALSDAGTTGAAPAYVSLVPTQLARLLDDPAGAAALMRFEAVLVGGAATDARLLEWARAAGAPIVTTYGMSETAGGCVDDGRPLPGVRVVFEDTGDQAAPASAPAAAPAPALSPALSPAPQEGRIVLAGAMVARGYLDDEAASAAAFGTVEHHRSFRTDDLGAMRDGLVIVRGRLDDVIVTGGLKVAPHVVTEAVTRVLPGVSCVVVGLPDPRWGQAVTAVLVADGDAAQGLRRHWPATLERLRGALPPYALPRRLETVPELPLRGPGKPDLAALRDTLAARPPS